MNDHWIYAFLNETTTAFASMHYFFLFAGAAVLYSTYRNHHDRSAMILKLFLAVLSVTTLYSITTADSIPSYHSILPLIVLFGASAAFLVIDAIWLKWLELYPPAPNTPPGIITFVLVLYAFFYPDFFYLPPFSDSYPELSMLGLHPEPLIALGLALFSGETKRSAGFLATGFFAGAVYFIVLFAPVYPEAWLLTPSVLYSAWHLIVKKLSSEIKSR